MLAEGDQQTHFIIQELVSFDESGGYDQSDATGFIKLNALRLRVLASVKSLIQKSNLL